MKKKLLSVLLVSGMTLQGACVYAGNNDFFADFGKTNTENPTLIIGSDEIEDIIVNTLYYGLQDNVKIAEVNTKKAELIGRFSDINNDDWYVEYLAMPIFYNVLNGYEDNTLRPNGSITPAEVAKVVSTAYISGLVSGGNLDNKAQFKDGNWYNNYYNAIAKAFTYDSSKKITDKYMNDPMRRCEVAYVLAKVSDDGTLNQYIERAKQGDYGQMASYTDFVNITDSDGTLDNEQWHMREGRIPARFAGAIMYLRDKNVMVGNEDGTMGALENVQRAQVFKLIQETCKITKSFNTVKFAGREGASTFKPHYDRNDDQTGLTGVDNWSYQIDFNAWCARAPITLNANDASRERAKIGDTFIAPDGTSYKLESTGIYTADGYEIAGVGLPVALDLGRSVAPQGKVQTVQDNWTPETQAFGWISKGISTVGHTYTVFEKTGEGHWDVEWGAIVKATRPTEDGTYDGQVSPSGYHVWDTSIGMWRGIVG